MWHKPDFNLYDAFIEVPVKTFFDSKKLKWAKIILRNKYGIVPFMQRLSLGNKVFK